MAPPGRCASRPGQWVRLPFLSATATDLRPVTMVGTPFTVVALDGHDLNSPQPLTNILLPIAPAQRYDVRFRMPAQGTVTLRTVDFSDRCSSPASPCPSWPLADVRRRLLQVPAAVIGRGRLPAPAARYTWFDIATYGVPRRTTSTSTAISMPPTP